ncbi:MAG TPA: hypothetical protein VGR07_23565 [Thermoanaerobaculia bacterium]|jgi:hypothetical protein|nr:hypothetical protein [Thermoanaerobaculia bacterium]
MKLKLALAASCLVLAVTTSASADYCINKDLVNLGPTAYDLGVLITGNQPLSWRYDGYPAALFHNFSIVPAGANEFLHWQNVNGSNAPILTGNLVHVGWCTVKPNSIVDMWWTDKSGGRVTGSVVYESYVHQSNNPRPGAIWNNLFANPLVVSNVSFALSNTAWSLDQLNRENSVLASQLAPLPGGTSFQVAPGRSVELAIPNAVPGQWLVLRYSVNGSGSQAETVDYAQLPISAITQ